MYPQYDTYTTLPLPYFTPPGGGANGAGAGSQTGANFNPNSGGGKAYNGKHTPGTGKACTGGTRDVATSRATSTWTGRAGTPTVSATSTSQTISRLSGLCLTEELRYEWDLIN